MLQFILKDYHANPMVFITELFAAILTIIPSVWLAIELNDTPMGTVYVLWTLSTILYIIAAIKRGSFGVILMMLTFFAVDILGLFRAFS